MKYRSIDELKAFLDAYQKEKAIVKVAELRQLVDKLIRARDTLKAYSTHGGKLATKTLAEVEKIDG